MGIQKARKKLFWGCSTTIYQLHRPFLVNYSYIRVVTDLHYGEIRMIMAVAYLRAFSLGRKVTKVTSLCP